MCPRLGVAGRGGESLFHNEGGQPGRAQVADRQWAIWQEAGQACAIGRAVGDIPIAIGVHCASMGMPTVATADCIMGNAA